MKKDWPFVFVILPVFLFLSLTALACNPPTQDEAQIAIWGLLRFFGIDFFAAPLFFFPSVKIPAMTCFYTGTFSMYLSVPFLRPLSLVYIRLGYIMFALMGLGGVYYCLRVLLGVVPAFFACLNMSWNSLFVLCVRRGAEHEELLVANLFWAGFALIVAFAGHGRKWLLFTAGFLWGLALFTKLLILPYLIALVCVYFCFGPVRELVRTKIASPLSAMGWVLPGFVIGGFPVFNAFLSGVGESGAAGDWVGYLANQWALICDWSALSGVVRVRIMQLIGLFVQRLYWSIGEQKMMCVSLLSVMTCIFFGVRGFLKKDSSRHVLHTCLLHACLFVYLAVFASLLFMPEWSSLDASHIMGLFPVFHILEGFALWMVLQAQSKKITAALLVCFAAAFCCDSGLRYEQFRDYYYSINPERVRVNSNALKVLEFVKSRELFPLFFWNAEHSEVQDVQHTLRSVIFTGAVPMKQVEHICNTYKDAVLSSPMREKNYYFLVLLEDREAFRAFCAVNSLQFEELSDCFDLKEQPKPCFFRITTSYERLKSLMGRKFQNVFLA